MRAGNARTWWERDRTATDVRRSRAQPGHACILSERRCHLGDLHFRLLVDVASQHCSVHRRDGDLVSCQREGAEVEAGRDA